ncbi:MAG: hypothetical protein E7277_01515 [Lachnospiraceae bacterium]|jgi:hypothetical protein|nr:hypothetical protein [Lachnospiraceae bacterium]
MAIENTTAVQNTYEVIKQQETKKSENNGKKVGIYGKTVGKPELSKEAEKYYKELKKKFNNMEFILVSKDQKENAKANAASYANPNRPVVLIDEEKVEMMATDEKFRNQYEGIIRNASTGLDKMKTQMESSGANVAGYGMQVKEDGKTDFFAVLKKSSADQKTRIEKKAAANKAAKKAADKKAEKKEAEEKLHKKGKEAEKTNEYDEEETVTIHASSIEDLMKKINDYLYEERADQVRTEQELQVGQYIDFKG